MPELPEVEALAMFLRERAVGRAVARVHVTAVPVLKTYDPPLVTLVGMAVDGVCRRGKILDVAFQGAGGRTARSAETVHGGSVDATTHLVVHLARAGWVRWHDEMPASPPRPGRGPLAFRLVLDDGSGFDLTEAGTRKQLAVYLVRDPAQVPAVAMLGVDPLHPSFTVETLAALLAGRRTQVKRVLRDQRIIAGIGNAYSDEVLHAARMSPFRIAADLTGQQVAALHAAIVTTLREAVARAAGSAVGELKAEKRSGLRVHGRTGEQCPTCGDTIRDVWFTDSALQYCPTCQTGGKPLADRRLSRLLK